MAVSNLKLNAAKAVLWWRSRPAPAVRYIRASAARSAEAVHPAFAGNLLRVAVVQVRAGLYESSVDFAAHMEMLVREASVRGAELIVLPEDNGTQLLGMLPGVADLVAQGGLGAGEGSPAIEPAAVIRFTAPYLRRAYHKILSELAGSYRRYIVGGSLRTVAADGRPVNAAYCFGPGGEILGSQEKLHLLRQEEEWGFVPGRSLTVVEGRGFRLAMPVCHDASYFETFRLALARGVDVVALPAANPEEYNEWYARRGIWSRVQETPVYGLASHLVGEFLGLRLTGRSGVFAPLELTSSGDGVIAQAAGFDTEELVVADLDLAALRSWRASGTRPAIPAEVVLRYLPGLYARSRDRGSNEEDRRGGEQGGREPACQQGEQDAPPTEAVGGEASEVEREKSPDFQENQQVRQEPVGEELEGQADQAGDLGEGIDNLRI